MKDKLVNCHFTIGELEFFNELMARETILTEHVKSSISGLLQLNVTLNYLNHPNVTGKLLSYIKKGKESGSTERAGKF